MRKEFQKEIHVQGIEKRCYLTCITFDSIHQSKNRKISQAKILEQIKLKHESLILAQDERWRRA